MLSLLFGLDKPHVKIAALEKRIEKLLEENEELRGDREILIAQRESLTKRRKA